MKRVFFVSVVALVVLMAAEGEELPTPPCSRGLQIAQPQGSPLAFEDLAFYADGAAYGFTYFTNKSAKDIEFYLIVLELLDRDGKYLMSVPIFNVGEKEGSPFEVPFTSWLESLANVYGAPIPVGTRSQRPFFVQLATLTCPSSARVSMIQLQYTDKTRFKYAAPSVNIPPVLLRAGLRRANEIDSWRGLAITRLLTIDSLGKVSAESTDSAPPALQRWLRQEIANWKFAAALTDAQAVATRLPFVLIIDNDSAAVRNTQLDLMRERGMSEPVIVLGILRSPLTENWELVWAPARSSED